MFHGPPGTGKTSLSFALAGIFGLDIYCISLMEVGLTESDLNKLFTSLPRRCIVLLEDIDSAGLTGARRSNDASAAMDLDTSSDGTSSEDGVKVSSIEAITKPPGGMPPALKSLISLSGLLNVIDGAASHEGRVLIMTTNHPESLDPALIRPGRVDLQVQFTLATRLQTRDIFRRMYSIDRDKTKEPSQITRPSPDMSSSASDKSVNGDGQSNAREDDEFVELLARAPVLDVASPEQLQRMADEFAEALPEGQFSPAEIQGFLLTRKKEPTRALLEVGKWRDEVLDARRGKGGNPGAVGS